MMQAHPNAWNTLHGSPQRTEPRPPCLPASSNDCLWASCDAFGTQCSPPGLQTLASPPFFPSLWHVGKGIGDPQSGKRSACVFARWITAVPSTGTGTALPHITNSWIRVSRRAAGKLVICDGCTKDGFCASAETHDAKGDSSGCDYAFSRNTQHLLSRFPDAATGRNEQKRERVGTPPCCAIPGSAVSETLFSRYAILQHG